MTGHEQIFRIGKKHVKVWLYIYKTKRAMRKRLAQYGEVEGICWKDEQGDCNIVISESGLHDGTAEHEAMHVIQFADIKNHEHQAGLLEQIITWMRSLIS